MTQNSRTQQIIFDVEKLLEREIISFQEPELFTALHGQVILVTGAAGSIGSELCRQLLRYKPQVVIALDTNETGLFELAESTHAQQENARLRISIGDITDPLIEKLFAREQPKIVFHAAAYKHVPLLEQFPDQAIRTNILAMYRLCCLAREYAVERFVFISTDKAAEPVSVMGASKRIGEMIVQALSRTAGGGTCFCAVRFGNVIGSRGSVVPIFARQIEQGGPVTVTDPQATRYFMTIPEACGLVILAAVTAEKGGLYLLDMGKAVRIMDLATKMIHSRGLYPGRDISIIYTGLRPGERLHETLIARGETLVPTEHTNIFSVHWRDDAPMLTSIIQWMHRLEQSLHHASNEQLREALFEIVKQENVLVCKEVDCAR
jgi:FlaA1/EpsC-like NDP-sugar epimerase